MADRIRHRMAGDEQMFRLFELSKDFRQLAPWDHRVRRPLLAVQHPDFPETAYICIMGFDCHRPGLAAYMSNRGYHCCSGNGGDWEDPLELVQRAYHLKVIYMDRDQLRKEERQLIRRLGLKFRNRFNWPAFRSFVPGYVTWHLLASEADFLIQILEQTCAVLTGEPRCVEQPPDEDSVWLRTVMDAPGKHGGWTTATAKVPEKPAGMIRLHRFPGGIDRCRSLCPSDNVVSVELFVSPEMLHDTHGRPYYPICLVMSDSDSGRSVHSTLIGGTPELERFGTRVANAFIDGICKCGIRPATVVVRSNTLNQVLAPVADALGISVCKTKPRTPPKQPWPNLSGYETDQALKS